MKIRKGANKYPTLVIFLFLILSITNTVDIMTAYIIIVFGFQTHCEENGNRKYVKNTFFSNYKQERNSDIYQ